MKRSMKCKSCNNFKAKPNTGGLCKNCFKISLQKECSRCKRKFIPLPKQQRNCGKCLPKKGQSVWVIGSAGIPGTGKNR